MVILNASGICLRVGEKSILEHITLEVESGEVLTILGANGAGKSSLVKILVGANTPTSGYVQRQVKRIGYVPQKSVTGVSLTVLELMQYFATIKKCDNAEITEVLSRTGLLVYQDYYIRQLSGGWLQRLTLAQALLGNPQLLVLDEPFVGLDQDSLHSMASLLADYVEQGGSVALTTHMLSQPFSARSRVALIESGKLVRVAPYEDIVSAVRLRILRFVGVPIEPVLQSIRSYATQIELRREWVDIVCAKEDRMVILSRLSEAQVLRDYSEEQLWQTSSNNIQNLNEQRGCRDGKYA